MPDTRSAKRTMPPSRMGRFLKAMRDNVGTRKFKDDADPAFKRKVAEKTGNSLSRLEASSWALEIAGISVSPDQIKRLETGRRRQPEEAVLRGLLLAYGLSGEEAQGVIEDPHLHGAGGKNPHLISDWRKRWLAVPEFGPAVEGALPVGDKLSTWVEVEKASTGGYRHNEVQLAYSDELVDVPAPFKKAADEAYRENEAKKERKIPGWTDNDTLCLYSVVDTISNDLEERRSIKCHFRKSKYRFNYIGKQEQGARYRAEALQKATWPLVPVPFLASGVGICVNVICDSGKSLVIGHRSNHETFRKGEYDIAVVEGLRPASDVIEDKIDLYGVAKRALVEELGLDNIQSDHELGVEKLCIFELGCDLEYYQWNFLAFAVVDASFDEIFQAWLKAKDRKESQTLRRCDYNKDAVLDLVQRVPFWSSGMACALRTFDYNI